jgi:ABC-2 type transport system permease protein
MIFTVAGKELKALFASPLAWVVLTFSQLILGFLFTYALNEFMLAQPQFIRIPNPPGVTQVVVAPTFHFIFFILLFAAPLLAMRLIAEERRNQTMVFLISAPLSMTEIVLGKFCGLMAFFLVIIGITSLMPLVLLLGGNLDFGLLASLIIGITLLAACFAAIGLYASCLTAHPFVAAMIAFGLLLAMLIVGGIAHDGLRERGLHVPAALAQMFSPLKNFEPFAKGMIDSYSIACMLLLIVFFLILTIRRLDAARLRG